MIAGFRSTRFRQNGRLTSFPSGAQWAAAIPATVVTWNPADTDSNITLSGGNLIATRTGSNGWVSARANVLRNSGKYYFEGLITNGAASPGMMLGLGTSLASLASYVGGDANGVGYNSDNGNKYTSGAASGAWGSVFQAGDVIGVAYDAATGKIWFSKNNVWQGSGDPGAGTNPAFTTTASNSLFPMCSLYYGAGAQTWTGKFKAADLTYSPPTGFSAWE